MIFNKMYIYSHTIIWLPFTLLRLLLLNRCWYLRFLFIQFILVHVNIFDFFVLILIEKRAHVKSCVITRQLFPAIDYLNIYSLILAINR